MGKPFVCADWRHGDHDFCLYQPSFAPVVAPHGRCDCHNCSQRRAAIEREMESVQTDRQKAEPKEKVQIARISRRNARKVARSSRRGYFGLAKAIMAK